MAWIIAITLVCLYIGCLVYILLLKKKDKITLSLSLLYIVLYIAGTILARVAMERAVFYSIETAILIQIKSIQEILGIVNAFILLAITTYYIFKVIIHKRKSD